MTTTPKTIVRIGLAVRLARHAIALTLLGFAAFSANLLAHAPVGQGLVPGVAAAVAVGVAVRLYIAKNSPINKALAALQALHGERA